MKNTSLLERIICIHHKLETLVEAAGPLALDTLGRGVGTITTRKLRKLSSSLRSRWPCAEGHTARLRIQRSIRQIQILEGKASIMLSCTPQRDSWGTSGRQAPQDSFSKKGKGWERQEDVL